MSERCLVLRIASILDECSDGEERIRLLGAVLDLEFGLRLPFTTTESRDEALAWLFSELRERLADSDLRQGALH